MKSEPDTVAISLSSVSYGYSHGGLLNDINLTINYGERVAIMGASGSGKTTLLKIMAGLSQYKPLTGVVDRKLSFSMVFQQPLLLDYLTVEKNILLPQTVAKKSKPISSIVKTLGLSDLLDRYPYQLSGGQQRRVSLARSILAPNNHGLLFDEPFTGLDESIRESILFELEEILISEPKMTCIISTHSPLEAAFLADRIIFIGSKNGKPATIQEEILVNLPKNERSKIINTDFFLNEVRSIRLRLKKFLET